MYTSSLGIKPRIIKIYTTCYGTLSHSAPIWEPLVVGRGTGTSAATALGDCTPGLQRDAAQHGAADLRQRRAQHRLLQMEACKPQSLGPLVGLRPISRIDASCCPSNGSLAVIHAVQL